MKKLLCLLAALAFAGAALAETPVETREITHLSERYRSETISTVISGGNADQQLLSAQTYALDGVYRDSVITLTQLLGLEKQEELVKQLVCDLVWQIVQHESQNPDSGYLDGLTRLDIESTLNPDTDFYLDADGNIVFFIQSGEIAGEMAGILLFPFAQAELMSALYE